MTKTKKIMIGSSILLILLVIGSVGFVQARGPFGHPSRGFGPPCMGRHGSGFHGPDFAGYMSWRMDQKAEALNLTELQKEKYEAWKNDMESHFIQGMEKRQQWMERFHEEINGPTPDVPMLIDSVKTKLTELSDFANQNLDLLAEFWNTLNDDQKSEIIEDIRERVDCKQ